jgi:hypothetical protein
VSSMARDLLGNERVHLSDADEHGLQVWVGVATLLWCAIYGWFPFVRHTDVPILFLMQVAVHETGHRAFSPFGEYVMLLMGSGSEILAPFLLGLVMLAWKRRFFGAGACWAVAAAACAHTAAYMADAPVGSMTLLGSPESDWLRIFDDYWNTLFKADVYAARVYAVGVVVWFAAVLMVVAGIVVHHRAARARPARPGRVPTHVKPVSRPTSVGPQEMWR